MVRSGGRWGRWSTVPAVRSGIGIPENLEEHKLLAVRSGLEVLPRLLVVLDEFNSVVMALGGARREFARGT